MSLDSQPEISSKSGKTTKETSPLNELQEVEYHATVDPSWEAGQEVTNPGALSSPPGGPQASSAMVFNENMRVGTT